MARTHRNNSPLEAEWYEEKGGNPQDWFAEKEASLDDIISEKAGIPKKSPFASWWVVLLVGLIIVSAVVVIVVASSSVPESAKVPPTIGLTPTALAIASQEAATIEKAFQKAQNDIKDCGNETAAPCTRFAESLASVQKQLAVKSDDKKMLEWYKTSVRTYAQQLFSAAKEPSDFDTGLAYLRAAKKLDPFDANLDSLERKADLYQQGWYKYKFGRFDEATGKFYQVWRLDPKFYNLGKLYYDSEVRYADDLEQKNNPSEALYHLRVALGLNVSNTEAQTLIDTLLAKYPDLPR